jgi:hypothetical protein
MLERGCHLRMGVLVCHQVTPEQLFVSDQSGDSVPLSGGQSLVGPGIYRRRTRDHRRKRSRRRSGAMWSPSPLSNNPTTAAADIAATSAPAGIDIRPHLTSDAVVGGDTPIEVGGERGAPFEREAVSMPPYNGGDDTTPCFDKWAATMPLFGSDAATKTSSFQDV